MAALSTEVPFAGSSLGVTMGTRSFDPSDPDASQTQTAGISTDLVQLLNNTDVNFHGGFTMECWFRWDGPTDVGPDALIDYAGTEKIVVLPSGKICLKMNDFLQFDIGTAIVGRWHYVAAVFDTELAALNPDGSQPGVVRTYLDSALPTEPAVSVTLDTFGDSLNRPIGIGMHSTAGFAMGSPSEHLNGRIFSPRVHLGAAPQLLSSVSVARSLTDLQLNGSAEYGVESLVLTTDTTGLSGSAFTARPRTVIGQSFLAQFSFRMEHSGTGADGITFVVQSSEDGAEALGGSGGGLGLSGIENSLAIVYDSFEGASGLDHEIRIVENGGTILQEVPSPLLLNDGTLIHSWVEYDGIAQTINVYLDSSSTQPPAPVLTQPGVDLSSLVGAQAHFGFTASTGGLSESHVIESYMLTQEFELVADECGAIAAPVTEGAWEFDTSLATTGGDAISDALCGSTSLGVFHNDVWFEYVASMTGETRISTCGSGFDTDLAVYTGTCLELVAVACNGDGCEASGSDVVLSVNVGESYFIRIGGASGLDEGPGLLTIQTIYPDECDHEPLLLVGGGVWPFDTTGATTGVDPSPAAFCFGTLLGEFNKDIWFTYHATKSGDTRIYTCGSFFNSDLAVYQGDCASLLTLGCNGDGCAGSGEGDPFASEVTVPVLAGETYLIRLGGSSSVQEDATLGILTIEERYVPPAFIGSYRLAGTIDSVTQTPPMGFPSPIPSFGSFEPGDGFAITLSFDTRIPATFGSDVQGFFDDSLLSVHFELGGGGYSSTATSGRIFQRDSDFGDSFNLFNIALGGHAGELYAETGSFDLNQRPRF